MTYANRMKEIEARESTAGFQSPLWASTESDGTSLNNHNILWRDDKGDVWVLLQANNYITDTFPLRDFLAHARSDVPFLLSRVKELEAALGEAIELSAACIIHSKSAEEVVDIVNRLTAIKEGRQ